MTVRHAIGRWAVRAPANRQCLPGEWASTRGKGDGSLAGSHDDDGNWEWVVGQAAPLGVQWSPTASQGSPAATATLLTAAVKYLAFTGRTVGRTARRCFVYFQSHHHTHSAGHYIGERASEPLMQSQAG